MGFRLLFLLGGKVHSDCSIKYVVSECPNYCVPGSCLARMTVFLKIAGDLKGRFRQIHRWYSNKLKRTDRDSWGICLNSLSQHQGTLWRFLFACSLMPGPYQRQDSSRVQSLVLSLGYSLAPVLSLLVYCWPSFQILLFFDVRLNDILAREH